MYIVLNSSIHSLYLILGLLILSGLISVTKIQIQLKFVNILFVGLFSIGIGIAYSILSFQEVGVLEIGSIILFYASSVYVSKAYTALQEIDKNKKQQ